MSLKRSSHLGLILGAIVVVVCLIVFAIFFRVKVYQAPGDECGRPPGPFYGSAANVDVALKKTLAVFRGEAEPKVIDVIPPDARTLEMIGYLSCKAQKAGLISTNEELRNYTALLGDIARGNPIKPHVRHFGTLLSLQNHLSKSSEADFTLVLDPATPSLKDFWVEEIRAKTWPRWFQKMCSRYSSCIECEPTAQDIETKVIIRGTSRLREVKIDGVSYIGCSD